MESVRAAGWKSSILRGQQRFSILRHESRDTIEWIHCVDESDGDFLSVTLSSHLTEPTNRFISFACETS